jgi:hypothetical protein
MRRRSTFIKPRPAVRDTIEIIGTVLWIVAMIVIAGLLIMLVAS